MKNRRKRLILVLVIISSLLVYLFVPYVNLKINNAVKVISSINLDYVVEYIRSYGKYAVLISFMLMILQSVAAPIPSFLITLSNAVVFGFAKGALLSWSSAMAGATLCFYIARILGQERTLKIIKQKNLNGINDFFVKYGKYAVLVARLLPFVSFDIISYAAGLTSISYLSFIVATGIGQLPATLIYSYVSSNLTGGTKYLITSLLCLSALSIVIYVGKKIYDEKQKIH